MQRIAVAGAGNLEVVPAILATAAQMFGERPFELWLFDADPERLELADRLARRLFEATENDSRVLATGVLPEAIRGADAVIVCCDDNCVRRFAAPEEDKPTHAARPTDWAYEEWPTAQSRPWETVDPHAAALAFWEAVEANVKDGSCIAVIGACESLPNTLHWEVQAVSEEASHVPHQVLRWAKSEDPVDALLAQGRENPLRDWLSERIL